MKTLSSKPVHVDSDDDDLLARVAAIDVAKDSGMACTRVPDESRPGKRATTVWSIRARTSSINELADQLAEQRIERVVLEATSDYWRPFYYLLEARGLTVWLVNARDVKNVPGRPKTDKLDAIWLAKLNERGMLRPSFVPPVEIRQLRDYTRLRADLTGERSRHIQRVEKLLEDALIKLSSVATNIMGVSSRAMLAAMIAGERDPHVLAELAKGRLRVKNPALIQALTGRFDEHHAELADILLSQIDSLTAQIEWLDTRAEQIIADIPAAQAPPTPAATTTSDRPPPAYLAAIERLDEITGIGRHGAQTIIAEVGLSMEVFPTSAHLCPGPKSHPAQSSPEPRPVPARPARATPTSKASSARPPPQPDAPTPSSAHATGASPDASASRKPRSQSLGPFWSSSGTYWPTPPADTTTSGRSSTTTASGPNAANATTSANSSHSATPSHSPKSPELPALATVYFPVSHQGGGKFETPASPCGRRTAGPDARPRIGEESFPTLPPEPKTQDADP